MLTNATMRGHGIVAGYGSETVLHGLDFAFPDSRTSVVLGPGGTGKTTLVRILSGNDVEHPDLWHRGELVVPRDSLSVLRQRLPTVGTVAELIGAAQEGQDGRESSGGAPWDPVAFLHRFWEESPEAADRLVAVLNQPVATLIRGLRRLVALTAAMGSSAPHLLLDEPEADLEPEEIDWVIRKLRQVRGTRTVIVVTHHLQVARSVGDYMLLLVDGKVCEAAPADVFFTRPNHDRTRYFIRMGS